MTITKVVTTAQMRALEQETVDQGATWSSLMEQAGWGVAQEAMRLLGDVRGRKLLVLVGPGNNGGDGLVAARHLHDAGAYVMLYIWRRRDSPEDINRIRCRKRDIPEYEAADDLDRQHLRHLLTTTTLVIDALLGIGARRLVSGDLAEIVELVNECTAARHTSTAAGSLPAKTETYPADQRGPLVLAVDMPTGVDSDSGALLAHAIQADGTVATGLIKRGALLPPGRSYAGALSVVEIGLTRTQLESIMSEHINANSARALLPARPANAHKGTFGKVMVVAGSLLYPGAASLATAGAARVGAGLVTLASARSALGGPGRLPEITLRPLPESGWGILDEEAADELFKHLKGYSSLLIGPGMGREKPTRHFLERLLGVEAARQRAHIGFRIVVGEEQAPDRQHHELPPLVIDADGLNLLSEIEGWSERLPHGRVILTPHPGEMKRLLNVEELPGDTVKAAEDAARHWGQIVVLKGATTVVANPEGRSVIHDGGNPALATAGTGDVLAGAISGLLAQGLAPFEAAVLGVYLHAAAGALAREELGDAGVIASDLLPRLPLAIKALR